MNNAKESAKDFLAKRGKVQTPSEEIINERDGLLERREVINKTMVTRDGKQLLREQRFEA